jgi:uncharacterized protein (TIGR02145 family)
MKKLIILLFTSFSFATVINIPDDYSTIQQGIDASIDGDTVLVQAGTYFENINFNGKNIVLTSDGGPESTIIDGGDWAGSQVVKFENGEIDVELSGFTIQNGNAQGENPWGGGIYINGSNPSLSDLIVGSNRGDYGTAIWAFESQLTIENTSIIDNTCMYSVINTLNTNIQMDQINLINNYTTGGRIFNSENSTISYFDGQVLGNTASTSVFDMPYSTVTIEKVLISNNNVINGSYIFYQCLDLNLNHLTVIHNSYWFAGIVELNMINSIVQSYASYENGTINITYSNLSQMLEGEGNFSSDPLFIDQENGDYSLQSSSPCIDTGDPNNEYDPDGTISDIGWIYFHQTFGCTDPLALNFDPDATSDDGSCEYFGTVTDIDGNIYSTVIIDDKVWMAENLRTTHYKNGDPIPTGFNFSSWHDLAIGGYAEYEGQSAEEYGNLYNWFTVEDDRGVCPENWHVPSDIEWQEMANYLIEMGNNGGDLKESGTIENGDGHWYSPNTGATNETGFTGLPGGYRHQTDGSYNDLGYYGYYWSSTEYTSSAAYYRFLRYNSTNVEQGVNLYINSGMSIRCIQNNWIAGCTDPMACNFDPDMEIDDGSCLYNDCMEVCGGEAFIDDCSQCSEGTSGHVENSDQDCNGECYGTAFEDDCGVCSEGSTGLIPNADIDCNADCFGTAFEDDCGICSEGNTGHIADSDDLGCGCFEDPPEDFYSDVDADGLGCPSETIYICPSSAPEGWVTDNSDTSCTGSVLFSFGNLNISDPDYATIDINFSSDVGISSILFSVDGLIIIGGSTEIENGSLEFDEIDNIVTFAMPDNILLPAGIETFATLEFPYDYGTIVDELIVEGVLACINIINVIGVIGSQPDFSIGDCINIDPPQYDCQGEPNGTVEDDICGVCDGPGMTQFWEDTDADGLGFGESVEYCADGTPGYNVPDGWVDNNNDECPNDLDNDIDDDGVCGDIDNCPEDANSDQEDFDGDGVPGGDDDPNTGGDVCDATDNGYVQIDFGTVVSNINTDVGTFEIIYRSNVPITYFTFNVDGIMLNGIGSSDLNLIIEGNHVTGVAGILPFNEDGAVLATLEFNFNENFVNEENFEEVLTTCLSSVFVTVTSRAVPDIIVGECADLIEPSTDCSGIYNGGSINDECGVCNGPGPNDYCQDTDLDGLGGGEVGNYCPENTPGFNIPEGWIPNCDDECPNDFDNDIDEDGFCGDVDNCPDVYNPQLGFNYLQLDSDSDTIGDACDNCVNDANTDQSNLDDDLWGDVCDNCVDDSNDDQSNLDDDLSGDVCDECPIDFDNDIDEDGICADIDNCPYTYNPEQLNEMDDFDEDGIGEACDNCPDYPNILQENSDDDSWGDYCDNCPYDINDDQADMDIDGEGDVCDEDVDGDGVINLDDNCPDDVNIGQEDQDTDDIGDVCDDDIDGDGFLNEDDNCPTDSNPDQADFDSDGIGDLCDESFPPYVQIDFGIIISDTDPNVGTVDIMYTSDANITYFSFDVDGISLTGVGSSNLNINIEGNHVSGFAGILPINETGAILATLEFDFIGTFVDIENPEEIISACFSSVIFSVTFREIPDIIIGDCIYFVEPPMDCNDIYNGNAVLDECDVCDGNGAALDCHGDCFGSAFQNDCGCVEGNTGLTEDYCYGCLDPEAVNYNPDAFIDDGSCNYGYPGCTDEIAINYNPDANVDDGTCYYLSDIDLHFDSVAPDFPLSPMGIYIYSANILNTDLRIGDEIGIYDEGYCIGMIQLQSEIGSPIQLIISQDNPDTPYIDGFTEGNLLQFRFWDADQEIEVINIEIDLIAGSGVFTPIGSASVNLNVELLFGCTDPLALNYNGEVTVDDGSCILPILGCTNEEACNYNPDANVEDGSCLSDDCTGECGGVAFYDDCDQCSGGNSGHSQNSDMDCNMDCFGTAYINECAYCVEGNTGLVYDQGLDCDYVCDGTAYLNECGCVEGLTGLEPQYCYGCMDPLAMNFDASAIYDDNNCVYPGIGDITMDGIVNVVDLVQLVELVLDGNDYIEYMDINQDEFLNIIDIVALVDIILHPETLGCTDPSAPNYNPDAFYNDGSCDYSNTVTDIDGNVYQTIVIGNQEWMAENLKVTHYRNGDEIPTGFDGTDWVQLVDSELGAFAIYDNEPENAEVYGNLYNWYAVDDIRNVCPANWHVPSDEDYMVLELDLGMNIEDVHDSGMRGTIEGGMLKEIGISNWHEPNTGATNESNFTALPGGYRGYGGGSYSILGERGFYWSSSGNGTEHAWHRELRHNTSTIGRMGVFSKSDGISVRCIKDNDEDYLYGCLDSSAINYNFEAIIDDGSCEYTDFDGNIFYSVVIGDQRWMSENLKVTHYLNGDEIPGGYSNDEWGNLSTGAYAYYDNEPNNIEIYGNLYNWYVIDDNRNIAPEGWRVPTNDDWAELANYLGGNLVAGGKLKAVGTIENGDGLWYHPNSGASNEVEFWGLPGGFRYDTGSYYWLGLGGKFWSDNDSDNFASAYTLLNTSTEFSYSGNPKVQGFSLRCIKNNENEDIYGCTNPEALNFDPEATIDDGSCDYSCIDIDGNSYETVVIGDQIWMAENLRVTHYRNGDEIQTGLIGTDWGDLSTGAFAIYDDDPGNVEIYGNLYNWYAVDDNRDLAPEGWHIPSQDEMLELTNYLGGSATAGGLLKEEGVEHWFSPNSGATNESGFSALPGGSRYASGVYYNLGYYGAFWLSTEGSFSNGWYRRLDYDSVVVHADYFAKYNGLSVRCVKDPE